MTDHYRDKRIPIFVFFILGACLLLSGRIPAQTTLVTLEGVVTDEENNPLPGATIIVRSMETGYIHSTTCEANGWYILSGIQPGKYEMEVSLSGFATQKRSRMTFPIGAKLKLDFHLAQAALDEEVTVTAESPMVEVTKSDISSVIDRQKIEYLPLLNREFSDLSILKTGVIGGRTNAMPTGMAEIMIDGMSNENVIQNAPRLSVPADAIQEFRIMTNQFEAEYGNASGMVRTAVTRSGTNDLRGRINYFYRDEILDSVNYFVNHQKYEGPELPKDEWEKSPYSHNNVAGFLGGPIKKDKAHFFISYDGLFRKTYKTVTSPLVPQDTIEVPETTHLGLVKLSYQPSEKHLLISRFGFNFPRWDSQGVGALYTKERAYKYTGNTYELQINWTYFPSDKTMNEFRALYVVDDRNFNSLPEFKNEYSISRPSGYFGKYSNFDQYNFADRYQFVENFSAFFGKHNLKSGFDFMYAPSGVSVFDLYIPGEFTFLTDKAFDPDDPVTYPWMFMYNQGDPTFTLFIYQFGLFVQDSWRVYPNLTLNFGLRYNYFTYTGLELNAWDFNNFNPRFAFSWDPLQDGKTVVRGGIGTYTANVMANIAFPNEFYKDMKLRILFFPGYPDPFQSNPFAAGMEIPALFDEYEVEAAPNPFSLQMTMGAQREIFQDISVSVDLVWTKGYSLVTWENKNPIIVGTGYIHENPVRGNVWYITNQGKSDYKALFFTFNKRYSHGWSLEVSYTLGRQEGNTESQDRPWSYEEDAWDRAWGRKNTDARHKITVSGVVDLPWGFQVSGLFYYRTAYPWNAVYPYDFNKDGLSLDYVDEHRNSREGFDWFRLDARISKYITISRLRLQVFAEIYNLTNRNNFGYDTFGGGIFDRIGLDGFGDPTVASDPRLMQLGFRVDF